ncbi:alpha/beta hydrolase [Kribbella hippodromi]|uniref:Alpha/beta hydrolase n=1 Tax=Kribbella hippodromi TaxID=434347 RepID=A0ABP4Q4E3_9ACTN
MDTITAPDGTTIGFRTLGTGPGLIVVHGALESAASYADLAAALSDSFTVHVLDRRGRGSSGPHGDGYGLDTEVADVAGVARATGAGQIFGVSSGAVIALQAGLEVAEITRVAGYEPALSIPGEDPIGDTFIPAYEDALRRGEPAEAMVTALKGLQVGPAFLRILPRRIAVALIRKFIAGEQSAGDEPDFTSLLPTLRYDFQLSAEGSADLERFKALDHPVLLLGGSRSPHYLKAALTALHRLLPDSRRSELRGANHNTANNRSQGGRPELVAAELRDFLTQ